MKKLFIVFLILMLLLSACSAQRKDPVPQTTFSSVSRTALNLEQTIEMFPYIFEGTPLTSEPYPASDTDVLMDVLVEKSYIGNLEEGTTIRFRTMDPALFPIGEKRLIFAEAAGSVFADLFYLYSSTAIYPVADSVNTGMIYGAEGKTYEEVIREVEEYVKKHQRTAETTIEGDYCKSNDLQEIYDFSLLAAEVIPQTILIDEVADRTTYICEVTDVLKGDDIETITVTVPKRAMELDASYILLLSKPSADSGVYVISAQRSVFLADSEEAELIRSFH